jgi:hypothetical protein
VGKLVKLREYLESKIDALDRLSMQRMDSMEQAVSVAMSSAKEATSKAENAFESRLALLNEFRSAMKDQASEMMPRETAEARFAAIEAILEENKGKSKGHIELRSLLFAAVGIMTGVVTVALAVFHH